MAFEVTRGNPFQNLNYCTFIPNLHPNQTDICWYVKMDLAFYSKVISMGFIVTIGLIGNLLLALTILLSNRLRSKSINVLIVFLSVSNILNLSLNPWQVVVDSVTEFYELGQFWCRTSRSFQIFFFTVPMLTLLLISIDRYLAIRFPFRSQKWDWKVILACAFILSVGGAAFAFQVGTTQFYTLEWGDLRDKWCVESSRESWVDQDSEKEAAEWRNQQIFWLSILTVVFIIPLSGTLLFYGRILWKIRDMSRQLVGLHSRAHNRSLHNVAVMVLIVVTTTIVCWTPITVYWLMKYSKSYVHEDDGLVHGKKDSSDLRYTGEVLIFVHAALQPLIYFFSGSKLRQELRRLMFACLGSPKMAPQVSTIVGLDTQIEIANTYRKKRKTGLDLTTATHTNPVCTTDEEITSGEDEVPPGSLRRSSITFKSTVSIIGSLSPTRQKLGKKSSLMEMLEFDPIMTAPSSPATAARSISSSLSDNGDTAFLKLESLLAPEGLQRKLSMISEILMTPKRSTDSGRSQPEEQNSQGGSGRPQTLRITLR